MESDLHLQEERYALAVDATNDDLWDWDLRTNKVFYSPRWKQTLGYKDLNTIGNSPEEWFGRLHPDDIENFHFLVGSYLQGKKSRFKTEYRIRHRSGHYLWVLCRGQAVWDKNGIPIRFAGFQTDITERKNKELQLFHDAFHDPLTGLANRALFIDRLNQALLSRTTFAVLYMDMDHFKQVNDTLGHKAGDELLVITARRLETCSRVGDTIARLGGDEFTILLLNISTIEEAKHIADRIVQSMGAPFMIEEKNVYGTISIGITLSAPLEYKRPEDVMRDADLALYQAKDKRKGGYEVFNEKMRQLAASHLKLENDLKKDLENGSIFFHYQPIIEIKSEKIVGFEALLRWQHEQYGILKPAEFLPLAEETQLIVKLEKKALNTACQQLKDIKKALSNKMFFITFNISLQQFQGKDFLQNLQKLCDKTSIHPSRFHLEIAENLLVHNPNYAEEMLKKVKKLGFKISFDGFGTGYSSLTYLLRYPFDFLKLAPAFVIESAHNKKTTRLIKTIIQLAQSLDITVIAEGIESEKSLNLLRKLHCTYAQGFYFSKPLDMEEIIGLLEKEQ